MAADKARVSNLQYQVGSEETSRSVMMLNYYITLDSAAAAAAPDPPAAVRQLPQGRAHDQAPQTAPGQL